MIVKIMWMSTKGTVLGLPRGPGDSELTRNMRMLVTHVNSTFLPLKDNYLLISGTLYSAADAAKVFIDRSR